MSIVLESYTDEELLTLMKSEDSLVAEVFSVLYDRHKNRIYAYALRVIGSKDDARDILQEVFVRFYQHLFSIEIANVGAYLLITTRNRCLNIKRSRVNYEELTEDIPSEEFYKRFESRDLITQLSKALTHLEFEQREAFVLRYYHSLEYDEIAEITGQSINAVRNRVWRAKNSLKSILGATIKDLTI